MSTMDEEQIRDEVTHLLRYSDVLSTTVRGVTRTTETYTVGVSGETSHTFLSTPIKDFTVVLVSSTNKYFLRDYTMNWNTGQIVWNSALTNGQTVSATYDYGSGDKIWPDHPRDDITLTSYPRIGITWMSAPTEAFGLGGMVQISDVYLEVGVFVSANKDTSVSAIGGLPDLNSVTKLVRSTMRANAKSLYTIPYMMPVGSGPLVAGPNNKILKKSSDYALKFIVENN